MKIFAATLLTIIGVNAYAADNIEPNNVPFQGVYGQQEQGKTRAQVQAELAQAKAQGLVAFGESEQPAAFAQTPSTATRAQVQQELSQARGNGSVTFGDLEYQAG